MIPRAQGMPKIEPDPGRKGIFPATSTRLANTE